ELCACKLARRHIAQIPRAGSRPATRQQKIMELAGICYPADVRRRTGFDERAQRCVSIVSQDVERPGKYRRDFRHALLVREAGLQSKQSRVDALENRRNAFLPASED